MLKKAVSFAAAALMACSTLTTNVSADTAYASEYTISALSAPKIVKTAKTTNSVTLKWSKVKGASGYKVYKKVGKKYKAVGTVKSGSKVKFKIKKLKSGKKYSFKVRAYKRSGKKISWSKYSSPKSVTTKADYTKYIDTLESCAANYTPEGFSADRANYMLEDLDSDGIKELLVEPDGPVGSEDHKLYIYSYNCGKPKLLDKVVYMHSVLLKKNNKYHIFWVIGGYWGIDRVTLKNGQIKVTKVAGGDDTTYPTTTDKYGTQTTVYGYNERNAFYAN